MIRCWRLDDGQQTLVLASRDARLPEVVYWGAPLPVGEDLETVARANAIDVTGGMLDENPDLSICPEAARSFPGQPGLVLPDQNGVPLRQDFRYACETKQANRLGPTFKDTTLDLTYSASFTSDPDTHMLRLSARLHSARPVHLHWFAAPTLPAPQHLDEMIDFAGRWIGEFQMNRTPWSAGIRMRESRTGRTGHEHFPGLLVPCIGATNTQGQAYAFHYGWSGGHRMVAEELPDGHRQVQFGHATETELAPATDFETAPLYVTFSAEGLNSCATAFQRHLRDRILQMPDPDRPRPVHYNCWEAVYFDHKLPVLKDIAERAAKLGAERFVLDDGRFGKRDDDTTSLGDWTIDARKYTQLIDHIHSLGMTFGIWFEPEMINPDSDTCRAHPDWALGPEDQVLGRQQMVLDMTRADILRLDSADPAVIAEQQLAEDSARLVVFAGKAASSDQIAPRPLRLTRLDPAGPDRVLPGGACQPRPRFASVARQAAIEGRPD